MAKRATAEERLARKTTTLPSSRKEEWILEITDPNQVSLIDQITSGTSCAKMIETFVSSSRSEIEPQLINQVLQQWSALKNRAPNPKVTTKNSSFSFICAEGKYFKILPNKQTQEIPTLKEIFDEAGIDQYTFTILSEYFVPNETLTVAIEPLKEKNSELYEKVVKLLLAANEEGVYSANGRLICELSDEEVSKFIFKENKVAVKEGLVNRLASLFEFEDIVKIMKILVDGGTVTWKVSNLVAPNANENYEKIMSELFPNHESNENFQSSDGKYIFEINGDQVFVNRKDDGVTIAVKDCNDYSHAMNTIKLWMRDPSRFKTDLINLM